MKNSNYKLSIIIPTYNTDKYIFKLLNNIIAQKHDENLEIIIIDDGSTDDTRKIVNEYLKKNNFIKYYYQENKGVSSARNYGLSVSNGEYIWFVDSDDILPDNTIKRLFEDVFNNEDVSVDIIQSHYIISKKQKNFTNTKNIGIKLSNNSYNSLGLCSNIISLKFLFNEGLTINEQLKYTEDMDFMLQLLGRAKSIYTIDYPIYIYTQDRVNSATKKITLKRIKDLLYFVDKWSNIKDSKYLSNFEVNDFIGYQYCILLALTYSYKESSEELDEIKKELRSKKYLLKKCRNSKVRLVSFCLKIFGYKKTCKLLSYWLKIK